MPYNESQLKKLALSNNIFGLFTYSYFLSENRSGWHNTYNSLSRSCEELINRISSKVQILYSPDTFPEATQLK